MHAIVLAQSAIPEAHKVALSLPRLTWTFFFRSVDKPTDTPLATAFLQIYAPIRVYSQWSARSLPDQLDRCKFPDIKCIHSHLVIFTVTFEISF